MSNLLLMRNELLLIVIVLILLLTEIFLSKERKGLIVPMAIGLFLIQTIVTALPLQEGSIFGGMYHTDGLLKFMKTVLNLGMLIVLLQSARWVREKLINENAGTEYYILLFSTLIGMYYLISAGDFLMFFLGIELSTLPLAGLVAFNLYQQKSAEAAIKLLLSAALASGISLYGISMIYGIGGSIYFNDLATSLTSNNLSILAFLFFFAGLAFKISLVPFHFWTADTYEGAPTSITAYLSVVSKGAAVFILMIVLYKVMGSMEVVWKDLMYFLAIVTMFVGNLFALRQKNMKRFLAFSSIAQAGFILLGIMSNTQMGMTAVIYFVLIYVFTNLAAFGVIQSIEDQTGKLNMDDYEGLYRTNPKLSLVMMLALFSLAGIPPVAGFFGKFFLFTEAASQGYFWLVLIAVVNVTIALYYYLLVIRAMFLRKGDNPIPFFKSDIYMRIALVICVFGIFVLGMYSPVYDYIHELSGKFF